jgi:hypothetical protein
MTYRERVKLLFGPTRGPDSSAVTAPFASAGIALSSSPAGPMHRPRGRIGTSPNFGLCAPASDMIEGYSHIPKPGRRL